MSRHDRMSGMLADDPAALPDHDAVRIGGNLPWAEALFVSIRRNGRPKGHAMPTEIVMDHTGDTRHEFDAGDQAALAEAERRFKELTGAGFTRPNGLKIVLRN
jgi:hypothetical protein